MQEGAGVSVEQAELELRERARLTVRAQLVGAEAQLGDLEEAVRQALPHTDAKILARAWLVAEQRRHAADAAQWSHPTDHDRLVAALDECAAHGVVVLLGVKDPSTLKEAVGARIVDRQPDTALRGVLWASEADVFHAVDHGILDVRLLLPDGTPAAGEDHLTSAVTQCVQRHGLRVRYHRDRVQVALRWQARPSR